ncbi:sigma-54 interaction domain-containing protein [Sutcliffiella halmapala]|uniref:sigma-54 interaction domain-containing protein n=1 Tax=Sutcliffiella halmapala TaxID=79882 RepID=UPI000995D03F|nr:sigma 54-interacting transcriptional regulator [Sutcliffiella halmapala]
MKRSSLLSKEMLEAILNGIDEAIHAVDQEGVTIYYNKIAAEHDGMKVEEVMGKHILHVFPSLTEYTSTLLKVLKTKKAIYHQNQRFENKNGKLIETINTTIPILDGEQLIGAVEIAKNYGQVKSLSNKLMDLQTKMYHKNEKNQRSSPEITLSLENFITVDPVCKQVVAEANLFASTSLPIIIYGETGTGKEIIAQGIHQASLRKTAPFITQNCGAIPESLLESILFGTEKGSYTGAIERVGLLELANGGTLFLDELNSMPVELQTKLLRVLEDGTIRRVGGTKTHRVDVRIITAMNESPEYCLKQERLREDLYFRLSTCSIILPPLRERPHDILVLANYFLTTLPTTSFHPSSKPMQLCEQVEKKLLSYSWPGNVRELKNTMEYVLIKAKESVITELDLPKRFLQRTYSTLQIHDKPLKQVLLETEKQIIQNALLKTDGNVLRAAKYLDIPRQTLQYKISKMQEIQEGT